MAKKMFNTDEFDALFDDATESSDMFSGLFSENINPDTEKVTDPNEIVKGGDVDPEGTEPDVKSSFESLFEDDDDDSEGDDKPAEGEETEGDDKPAEGEETEGTKPVVKSSFESLFEDDDDSADGEADDGDGDSEDLDSDLFENFIL